MMIRKGFMKSLRCAVVVLALCMVQANAYEEEFDLNALIVRSEMYIWNRITDFLDIFHGGIAGGPGIGFEVAVTDYGKLGAYVSYERGVDFPHFLPPLWLIDYYGRRSIFNYHEGYYATVALGPWRKQILDANPTLYFPRGEKNEPVIWANTTSPWDLRVQLDALLIHPYVNVRTLEIADFFAGIVGLDPKNDDQECDDEELARRQPADQFGRGVCNILFGALEIPFNIIRLTNEEGDLPGISKGVGLGFWRFACREVVGVVELVTFPFGWSPIIEPEYVVQKKLGPNWKVNRPAFHKNY
ncbi:MAG: exosortase system-associated protein, TIGR04073 family [Victivallales bacterium]|nr:exosortase system-associated protein, TIGR04073 family [Victivallales bacterium]